MGDQPGAKQIAAAEASLLGTAETPLAILLAWWLLAALPPAASLAGGAIVLTAVLAHAARDLAKERRRAVGYQAAEEHPPSVVLAQAGTSNRLTRKDSRLRGNDVQG